MALINGFISLILMWALKNWVYNHKMFAINQGHAETFRGAGARN